MENQNTASEVNVNEALNNATTTEECLRWSEYLIKVAFSFMKKAEQIKMSETKTESEKPLEVSS